MWEENINRKMIKKSILILLFASFLVFAGCSSNTDAKKNGYELNSFKGGSEGLVATFDESMPPATVKDQGIVPFNVRIVAENKGEYDIPENSAHVRLTGFDAAELNLQESAKTFAAIPGFKKLGENERPGARQTVMFNNLKYMGNIISGTYNVDISANVCYPYETNAIAEVCISGNTYSGLNNDYENCEIEGDKKFANSGGPVQIENVKQFSNGQSSIQIQFDIVHKPSKEGAGTVYERGSLDNECNVNGKSPSSSDAILSKNKVKYLITSSIPGINCEGTGTNTNTVFLSNDKYTVTCIQDTTDQGDAFNKLIQVKLEYDYMDRISKTVTVEHIER